MSPVTNLIYQALREEPPLTGFRRSSPLRGASILPYDCGGSPGGELDAKRPEGWFPCRKPKAIESNALEQSLRPQAPCPATNPITTNRTSPRNGQDRSLQSILLCAANPQTPSRAGVPDSAGNLPEQIQKACDVLCPTVGDGVLDVPDGHINDCTFAGNLPPQKIARTT